jgi:putative membrane protein
MSWLFAFLHHVAAFALVGALTVEFVVLRGELTVQRARQVLAADLALGFSASAILVVGFLRVFYFEKGASYYFHSVPFIVKMTLFVMIGLLSIYPTVEFLSWRKHVKEGRALGISERKLRLIRAVIHWELVAITLMILCAALMARGVWELSLPASQVL